MLVVKLKKPGTSTGKYFTYLGSLSTILGANQCINANKWFDGCSTAWALNSSGFENKELPLIHIFGGGIIQNVQCSWPSLFDIKITQIVQFFPQKGWLTNFDAITAKSKRKCNRYTLPQIARYIRECVPSQCNFSKFPEIHDLELLLWQNWIVRLFICLRPSQCTVVRMFQIKMSPRYQRILVHDSRQYGMFYL